MDAEDARLREWIGRTETARDVIHSERARALQATLDREPLLRDGDALPPLWHWLYFWTTVPRSGLGRDGHPALGGFLPPVGAARRMWAGSRVRWPGRLLLGDQARRTSSILDVVLKTGRTGRLVFVTVRHEVSGSAGLAIVDEHDIVYREDTGAGVQTRGGEPAPAGATFSRPMQADSTMLFRYSALTFNGHRIHYDQPYVTGIEGYPGLIVHGPLLGMLQIELARRSNPDKTPLSFEFRALAPVYAGAFFSVQARREADGSVTTWIADHNGGLAQQGRVTFQ
jgi:3-methylfumaryl-CoA hydratase